MTVQELLQNEVILPSTYFKSFDQNAQSLKVDIKDIHFENEVSNVITEEWANINTYMNKTTDCIDTLSEVTDNAQRAISDQDEEKLKMMTHSLLEIKEELHLLKELIYIDALTKVFNRKWIYNQRVDNEGKMKDRGLLLFIDVSDCKYLSKKYGQVIADNVIKYISKFLAQKLSDEKIDFDIARYSHDQFIIFVQQESPTSLSSFITNSRLELANATLKSKSGLTFKTTFNFGIKPYTENDLFQSTLESAASTSSLKE